MEHRPFRIVVIAPTFNNAATLAQILDALAREGWPVIVINDGSTDATPSILAERQPDNAPPRWVTTHPTNHGKAQALRTGFVRATELGFTHAVTIDTDGQHDPADVQHLARELVPDTIILGTRSIQTPGYPLKSRMGRRAANLMITLTAGLRVQDSQCGLRIYPLDVVDHLNVQSGRYAMETEVLVRAAWAGVGVIEVPVRCIYELPSGRVTHFRAGSDSLHALLLYLRLLTRSLMPWPYPRIHSQDGRINEAVGTISSRLARWLSPVRTWRNLKGDLRERDRVAASMGWGMFVGLLPPFGGKTVLCLILARVLKLQPLIVISTSSLTTPPLGFLAWAVTIAVGFWLMHGGELRWQTYDLQSEGLVAILKRLAIEWTLGGLVCGLAMGLLTFAVVRLVGRCLPQRQAVAIP